MKTLAITLALACALHAQTVLTQFDGYTGNGGTSPNVVRSTTASNGTQLLEINGQSVNYYTTAGVSIAAATFTSWLAAVSPTITCGLPLDPRAYYDSFISRWIVVQSCSSGDWLIVSNGSSLTSPTWKAVAFGGPLGANGDLTMRIGFDKNGIYLSEFDSTAVAPNSYNLFGIPGADLAWSGGGSPSLANLQAFPGQGQEIMCGIDMNSAKLLTDPVFCVSLSSPSSTSNVSFSWQIDRFTWPSGGVTGACTNGAGSTRCASLATRQSIASNFKANPLVDASQPSSSVKIKASESSRVFGVWESGTHLYLVRGAGPCTATCGTQGIDANTLFFFADVNLTNPASLSLQQSLKVSSASVGYLFPEIVIDSSGNVVITATASGAATFPSIYSWYRLTTDALSTLRGPTVVTTGTLPYTCSTNNPASWGTYFSGAQDPVDGTKIWMVHQYGGNASSCVQKTRLIEFQPVASTTTAPTPAGNFSNMQVWGAIQ